MYNVKSKQAEEFIDHQEILDTLDYALSNKKQPRTHRKPD